ncbi:PREDICTED: classical arabinogalactan protein 26 [Ipomoea nil]|uniref:classical arabinogalactan protein 26 n=1 Tax=Ipomoea nil TaxID=35883 RepID=UPI0009016048|nr:PREDICTED: classical arabinogalactan protein 26 [Ipomoea nil]
MASTSTTLFLNSFMIFLILRLPHNTLSLNLPTSTISAAPSLLPFPPSSSPPLPPALSPDITPLFPSPGGSELAPSDSSLPTIPSSPSPPNPDEILAPGPLMAALSPSGSLPVSPSVSLHAPLIMVLAVMALHSAV